MKRSAILLTAMLFLAVSLSFSMGSKEDVSDKAEESKKQETKYKIGMVFDVGGRGDKSFNDSAYAGLVRVAKEFNGKIEGDPDNVDYGSEVVLKYLEPKSGGQDREQLLRVLAEDGYQLVVGVGFAFSDSIAKVAKDFPDSHFVLIDGYIPELTESDNITCISFAEHEGSFLVGALAGMVNDGGKIGFIGGMDIPLIHKFAAGYMAGAMYVNENIRDNSDMYMGQYIGKDPNAFKDAPAAYNIANSMYKQGASIIYHASGASGDGLFQAAEEHEKLAVGVDGDQGASYSSDESTANRGKYIITSMLKRVDVAVYTQARTLIETGDLNGGYHSYGIKDNGVGIAVNDYNEEQLEPYMDEIEAIKSDLINGKVSVPQHEKEIEDWKASTF